jgi:hypothetical protein
MSGQTFVLSNASAPVGVHALTFAKLKNAVKHALGKTTVDSTTDLGDIVNDGVALFYGLHPWTWRETALSVDTVAAQQYVSLPADFAEMSADPQATSGGALLGTLVKSSLDDINQFRATLLSGIAASMRYAVTWKGGTSDDDLPVARLELWPAPTAVITIHGMYRRQLRKLIDDGDVPDVPAHFHQLLKRVVRAHALDEDDQADAAERAWAHVNALLPGMKEADGRADANLGRMRGATASRLEVGYVPQISLE